MNATCTSHATPHPGCARPRIASQRCPTPRRVAAWAVGVVAFGLSTQAAARRMLSQTLTGVEAELKDDVRSAAGPRSGSQFSIGLGTAYLPRYKGANEHKLRALPVINYRNGRFFAGVPTGVGGGKNGTSVRLSGGWATALGPTDRLLLDLSVE